MITVIPEPVPEAAPAPVVEEEVPQAAPALPKTAGVPLELFGLLATGMLGMGLMLRKKEK